MYAGVSNRNWKTEVQAIFLNLFTVCSSCKRKFVVCPFVYAETNRIYPFANGLNGLAHLWYQYTVLPPSVHRTVERGDGSYDSTSLFNITYAYI